MGRLPVLDSWKGWLVLLVVFGHVVGAVEHLAPFDAGGACFRAIYKWISLFNMSAFHWWQTNNTID